MNRENKDQLEKRILEIARDRRLPCALALKLAADEQVPPSRIGELANALNLKIVNCQLGCFK